MDEYEYKVIGHDHTDWSVSGWRVVAEMPGPVNKLEVRRGRLTARVGDMWHIVPIPSDETPSKPAR